MPLLYPWLETIGVTGIMHPLEVEAVVQHFTGTPYRLIAGILVSGSTFTGAPHGMPGRYPALSQIRSCCITHPQVLNFAHYALSGTKREKMRDDLNRLMYGTGLVLHGLQLNITWPDPHEIERFLEDWPHLSVILQLNTRAWDKVEKNLGQLQDRLLAYHGSVDSFLVDFSGGMGKTMDPGLVHDIVCAITQATHRHIIVAGGLGGLETTNLLVPLFTAFPLLSVDAENKLRNVDYRLLTESLTPAERAACHDRLDLHRCEQYIKDVIAAKRIAAGRVAALRQLTV